MSPAFSAFGAVNAGSENPGNKESEQVVWLSPRLPGKYDPGVFEMSGPGNDGMGSTHFMLYQSGKHRALISHTASQNGASIFGNCGSITKSKDRSRMPFPSLPGPDFCIHRNLTRRAI